MDIHRPKPVRSLREFASEIGVIVIGVAIALAGEQSIEWLHWRSQVADTRQALIAELSQDVELAARTRQNDPCKLGLLDELERWARDPHGPSPSLNTTPRAGNLLMLQSSAWEVSKTGQGAASVPLDDRLAFARVYNQLDEVNSLTEHERETAQELVGMMGRPDLTTAERRQMLQYVNRWRGLHKVWIAIATEFESEAKHVGAKPPTALRTIRFPDDCALPREAG